MPAMDYSKVADLYDAYAQTDMDVRFFVEEAQGCRNVLELTSGTGRLSLPLLLAGVPLTSLDSSGDMLDILRKKLREQGLSAPVHFMDMVHLSLPESFDLIIIPFNAFSEITDPLLQKTALTSIRSHLAENGRLVCTLHNPAVRKLRIDGQPHRMGPFVLPDRTDRLFLTTLESLDPHTSIVSGNQTFEITDPAGIPFSERIVELAFFLHTRQGFEDLYVRAGFETSALFGDYERNPFDPEKSPFMIWILKKGKPSGRVTVPGRDDDKGIHSG